MRWIVRSVVLTLLLVTTAPVGVAHAAPQKYDVVLTVTQHVGSVDTTTFTKELPIDLGGALPAYSKWYAFGAKASAGNRDYTVSMEYRHEVLFHWETHYRFSAGRGFVDQVGAHAWFDPQDHVLVFPTAIRRTTTIRSARAMKCSLRARSRNVSAASRASAAFE